MTQQQRGQLMLVAASSLALCLLFIVGGFVAIAIRAGDGEATKLLTDNLWQLVWPLVLALGSLAGISVSKLAHPGDGSDASSAAPASQPVEVDGP